MRAGEFRNGERVLRAKIDMASANMNLRDPVIYRILNASHPRTGAVWHIYPSYDFAHGQCDAIEEVSHSLSHPRVRGPSTSIRLVPRQPPGAIATPTVGLRSTHATLSKRALTELVRDGHVAG
jgi:glutaminyl-tRNA synthetase